jgi:integrase
MTVWYREDRGRWVVDVDFEFPDGRRVRIKKASPVNTKKGAEEYERQVRADLLDPRKRDRVEIPTFGDFVRDRWWPVYPKSAGNKPSTIREKKYHLEVHLVPFFETRPLDQIDKENLDRFVAGLVEKDLSPKRVKNILATLRRILQSALEWKVLRELPAFPKIKVPESGFDFYEKEESDRLIAAARNPMERALFRFAVRTGARAGEQIALEWPSIDFHNKLVHLRASSTDGIVEDSTKSRRIRKIPLGAELVADLREIQKEKRGPLVFCNEDGRPFTLWQLHHFLETAQASSGLRRIRYHDLRHTFASQLAIAGTPLPQIQQWMGHATITMTMRYAHLLPSRERDYLAVLESA